MSKTKLPVNYINACIFNTSKYYRKMSEDADTQLNALLSRIDELEKKVDAGKVALFFLSNAISDEDLEAIISELTRLVRNKQNA